MTASLLWGVTTTNPSAAVEQSFVLADPLLYVMDNHRAALWCWLREIDVNTRYNLLHIDRHYDTLGSSPDLWDQAVGGRALVELTLEEYLEAKAPLELAGMQHVFRFDNYIDALRHFYPNVLGRCYFATHGGGSPPAWDGIELVDVDSLPTNLDYWFSDDNPYLSSGGWIVNIDMDYFFYPEGNSECRPIFSKEYVDELFGRIKVQIERGTVKVITVALSPSNTGDWNRARNYCSRICGILGWPDVMRLVPEAR